MSNYISYYSKNSFCTQKSSRTFDKLRGHERDEALQRALGITATEIDDQLRPPNLSDSILAMWELAEAIEAAVRGGDQSVLGLNFGEWRQFTRTCLHSPYSLHYLYLNCRQLSIPHFKEFSSIFLCLCMYTLPLKLCSARWNPVDLESFLPFLEFPFLEFIFWLIRVVRYRRA